MWDSDKIWWALREQSPPYRSDNDQLSRSRCLLATELHVSIDFMVVVKLLWRFCLSSNKSFDKSNQKKKCLQFKSKWWLLIAEIWVQMRHMSCFSYANNLSASPSPLYLWKSSLSNITSPTDSLLACRNLSMQCLRRGSDGWRPVFFRALRRKGSSQIAEEVEIHGNTTLWGILTAIKYENGICSFPSVIV